MADFEGQNKSATSCGEIADAERSDGFCSERDGAVTHATRSGDGRQEGRERGYCHLHRNLNQSRLLHTLGNST